MGRTHIPRVTAAVVALAVAGAFGPAPARAGSVILLKTRALPTYDAVVAGFRTAYGDSALELSLETIGPEQLDSLVAAEHPDAVVAIGRRAALTIHARLPQTPLVYCAVLASDQQRLAGPSSTGVLAEWSAKAELDALEATAPGVCRVAFFYDPADGSALIRGARRAAKDAGLTLVEAPIRSLEQLGEAARKAEPAADALWMPPDATLATPEAFRFLLDLSLASRKPMLAFSDVLVHAGALVSCAPDYGVMGARVADAVRRIQAGERAGDIPVTRLRPVRVVVNQSTAQALGLTLSTELESTAEVIR